MKNNMDIDMKNEKIEEVAVESVKEDKVTSAKIFDSTKDIIKTLELKGNQQEQLDQLAKGYKKYLEESKKVAKTDIVGLDLSDEFNSLAKQLDVFVKNIELKTNTHMSDSVATTVSNTEKEFTKLHNEFMKYLEEVKGSALASASELEEKTTEIEGLVTKVKGLNETIEELESINSKIDKEHKDLVKMYNAVNLKKDKLEDDLKYMNAKLENEKSLVNSEKEKSYKLKNDVKELKEEISGYKAEFEFKKTEIEVVNNKNKELEVKNKELEVAISELKVKNSSLLEENKNIEDIKKDIFEKIEQVAQLEKRNEILENDLKELNTVKSKNIELEGTVKGLEGQYNLLQTTLNTITTTISSITESKVIAEEKANNLELENTKLLEDNAKLLKELEELKKQVKAKK